MKFSDRSIMLDTDELYISAEELINEFRIVDLLNNYSTTIDELLDFKISIENYGITPSCMSFATNNKTLSRAIPEIASLEVYGFNDINSDMTTAALEGVSDKIKDLTAAWFNKLWNFVSNIGTSIKKFCSSMYEHVKTISTWTKNKLFDILHYVKTKITTHPFITIAAALIFLIAVAPFIQGLVGGNLPTSREEYFTWYKTISTKVSSFIADKGSRIFEKKQGTPQDLGYTKDSMDEIEKKSIGVFEQNGKLEDIDKSLNKLKSEADANKNTSAFTWIRKSIQYLCMKIKDLFSVIVKASRTIMQTFIDIKKSIGSIVTDGEQVLFKAQALDNTSPDHYSVGDAIIDSHDVRAGISGFINKIAIDGKTILKSKDIEVISLGKQILIQVMGNETDVVGRKAPIICVCSSNTSTVEIVSKIKGFASSIGRTIDVESVINALNKKV